MTSPAHPRDWTWNLWFTVPLYPYGQRRTLRQEVVPNQVWTFDQLQGILYVLTPIRMTAVKLAAGGLLIYAPIAPTPECLRLVNELVALHGPVQYIILPTISGLEHKVFVGPFARHFPQAQVYVAPGQWSFPINLPLSWLGFPLGRTQTLPLDSRQAPFGEEFDYAILSLNLGLGQFGEVALLHRRSHTLLLTDAIVSIPEDPPAIIATDPTALLYHAKDSPTDSPTDTPAHRRKGWQRSTLFAFYFTPSALDPVDLPQAWRDARQAPDRSRKALWGLYPFRWQPHWPESFAALRRDGQLLVAPILQALILNRDPQAVRAWASQVAEWNFHRIIPCHFDAPISATPEQFRRAFDFLDPLSGGEPTLSSADFALLHRLSNTFTRLGVTPPAQP
jgi:Domain of unknown function (DUF4336)